MDCQYLFGYILRELSKSLKWLSRKGIKEADITILQLREPYQ